MSNDQDENVQNNNQESGESSSGDGNLPDPDPDLSDYHKRDGGGGTKHREKITRGLSIKTIKVGGVCLFQIKKTLKLKPYQSFS